MTDQQYPGGVIEKHLDTTYLSPGDRIGNARWHAKKLMYDELSAEARAILAEEGFERRSHDVNVLTQAFLRLGLDLSEPNGADDD